MWFHDLIAAGIARDRSAEVHGLGGAVVALAATVAGMSPEHALTLGVAAGAAVEAVQWAVPRLGHASWADVAYTAVGAAAGAGWAAIW